MMPGGTGLVARKLLAEIDSMEKVADRMDFVMSDAWYDLGMDEICRLARQLRAQIALYGEQ